MKSKMELQLLPAQSAFRTYLNGVVRLHSLARAKLDETEEADEVRDSLDLPWTELTEEERAAVRALSEDLYLLADPVERPLSFNPQVVRMLSKAHDAQIKGRFDEALAILRRWGRYLDPAELAFRRGLIWRAMGHPESAVEFFDFAATLKQNDWRYDWARLTALAEAEEDRAFEVADALLAEGESLHPQVMIAAAHVLLSPEHARPEKSRSLKMRTLSRHLLKLRRRLVANNSPDLSEMMAYRIIDITIGRSFMASGKWRFARIFFRLAALENPENLDYQTLNAIVEYRFDAEGAAEEFRRIRDLNPSLDSPHFFLAHYWLSEGDYGSCIEECDKSLELSSDGRSLALVLEWRAIARSKLHQSPERIRSDFASALTLDPANERIRHNAEAYERFIATQGADQATGSELAWEKPTLETVMNVRISQIQSKSMFHLPAA